VARWEGVVNQGHKKSFGEGTFCRRFLQQSLKRIKKNELRRFTNFEATTHPHLPLLGLQHTPTTPRAAIQEELRRSDERQECSARNLVKSFAFGAPGWGEAGQRLPWRPPPAPPPPGTGTYLAKVSWLGASQVRARRSGSRAPCLRFAAGGAGKTTALGAELFEQL
jgi:hypothetical protein